MDTVNGSSNMCGIVTAQLITLVEVIIIIIIIIIIIYI